MDDTPTRRRWAFASVPVLITLPDYRGSASSAMMVDDADHVRLVLPAVSRPGSTELHEPEFSDDLLW